VARAPCARIREKRGPLLTFVSERGPCAPVRNGERSGGRRKKNPLLYRCWWGRRVAEVADEAESRVSDVALLGKFPRTDSQRRDEILQVVLPRLPITLLPRHEAAPSLSHHTLGRALSPKLLWDVPSPSPHSGTPSLWDAPPYFFLSFSFSANSLTVHRGPPLAHRREGVGFFHNAAPFRSRSCGVTLHLVHFFYLFPFLFRSLTTLFLTCPFATRRVALVASPPSLCHVSRRPSSPLLRLPPVSLSLSLPLRLDATTSLPLLWDTLLSPTWSWGVIRRRLVSRSGMRRSTLDATTFSFFFLVCLYFFFFFR
jgi:hypothetical protein